MKRTSKIGSLAVMSRVAQVRDVVQRQKLAVATKDAQRQTEQTERAESQLRETWVAMEQSTSMPSIDLGRLGWIQDLAAHADKALDGEKQRKSELDVALLGEKHEAQLKSYLRDRFAETEAAARMLESKEHDARQLEQAIEAWQSFKGRN
ncbi:hypothetical protein [Dyella ginsengisoli]|uniref:hypothetical protein n=1 Tax=Dyella ginsengisoli TaxID=363848 RepID=UPI000365C422|nr:hypothetical protein [Dyella ginsengisoli]